MMPETNSTQTVCLGCGKSEPAVRFLENRRRCVTCRRTREAYLSANPGAVREPKRVPLQTILDRLLAHRERDSVRGCWNWTGFRDSFGYGQIGHVELIGVDGNSFSAHRLSAHIFLGLDLNDRFAFACHRCDNPQCFNPAHLFKGDPRFNVDDCVEKGRLRAPRGSRNLGGGGKLSESDIVSIRRMSVAGYTQDEIGKQFGVHSSMIGLILRRKKWRHVE